MYVYMCIYICANASDVAVHDHAPWPAFLAA